MIKVIDLVKEYHVGHSRKRVLNGVNFEVARGERFAVLGRNGAGKSTLVRLLGGLEHPTSGEISRGMSLSWPLGLNGGFQGSLTGIDNMKFVARIYDKPYRDVFDFVEYFSELGSYLAEPVKTYSSGMRARLAFGLSLAIDFDCYLIDEVIFVGDQRFHRKCREEIFEKRADRSLLLVSHDANILNEYCNGALILHNGRSKVFEDVPLALDIYNSL
ncbi:capsular polysaccharide transport system ATP-binding protein [Roseibium hamelinense]|uniref:Capsular polysaccharide transport system ATP-binding protein n=1 Tax=Roseibium hamelinense TaxID=150831 RepID=A0A562T2E0_9HYPH|nr:ABC transporter ATP-binding protein [Roseibium hamelinense]MTI44442.1 ABC transporter ATP-binding protein [Roseibium hamelinense]TWI87408.1 capsular polysaccharide transport system ATP-binding protein [Roseibium hamelinense]